YFHDREGIRAANHSGSRSIIARVAFHQGCWNAFRRTEGDAAHARHAQILHFGKRAFVLSGPRLPSRLSIADDRERMTFLARGIKARRLAFDTKLTRAHKRDLGRRDLLHF